MQVFLKILLSIIEQHPELITELITWIISQITKNPQLINTIVTSALQAKTDATK